MSTEITLVSDVNRMIGSGQFAHHADEDEAPGRDHACAQERRRDVAQRDAAVWRRECGSRPPDRACTERNADCIC